MFTAPESQLSVMDSMEIQQNVSDEQQLFTRFNRVCVSECVCVLCTQTHERMNYEVFSSINNQYIFHIYSVSGYSAVFHVDHHCVDERCHQFTSVMLLGAWFLNKSVYLSHVLS